jgi:hypothetical protein
MASTIATAATAGGVPEILALTSAKFAVAATPATDAGTK